jgi:hypothetical protein
MPRTRAPRLGSFERGLECARWERVRCIRRLLHRDLRRRRCFVVVIVDHHQCELATRGGHHARAHATDARRITFPGEPSAHRRECRGDGLRGPALVREERARERGSRGAARREREPLQRRFVLGFYDTRRTGRCVAKARVFAILLFLGHDTNLSLRREMGESARVAEARATTDDDR